MDADRDVTIRFKRYGADYDDENAIVHVAISEIETHNAMIENTAITLTAHGKLIVSLRLQADYNIPDFWSFVMADHFIRRVMQIADVNEWAELQGKAIRVKTATTYNGSIIPIAIGHITKEDWLNPAEDYEKMRETGK